MSRPPANPKVYHVLHLDRLPHVLRAGFLFSDAIMRTRPGTGTTIGLGDVKQRRLRNRLASHPDLCVGRCVPFYFCPRSVMLYVLYKRNMHGLSYQGAQQSIVHLELDLRRMVAWCDQQGLRWAFTLSNAGAVFFEDRSDLSQLDQIDWEAVRATQWADPDANEGKQAEFLVENQIDWSLVECIGAEDQSVVERVHQALGGRSPSPVVPMERSWHYP